MHEQKVRDFDKFYTENYKYLISFSKSINPKADYESLTHDVFLRCRTRIADNGYSGETYLNFVRVSLMNFYKSNYRNEKNRQFIDINDQDYYGCVEDKLQLKEEQYQQEIEAQHKSEFLNEQIFEYLDKYYSSKEQFVFKTYFLLKHKHLNYRQLSEATNYSITAVSNIIKKIKKDIKLNIKCYILTGMRMEELLKETQNLLNNPISNTNWIQYKQHYKKIFGTDYRGCSCKRDKLYNAIKDWYILNNK